MYVWTKKSPLNFESHPVWIRTTISDPDRIRLGEGLQSVVLL